MGQVESDDEQSLDAATEVDPGYPALIACFPRSFAMQVPLRERLGREWISGFGVEDRKVSREHFMFSRPDGVLRIVDLGSHNGSFLNGERLVPDAPTAVAEHDVLRVGRTVFVYRAGLVGNRAASPPLGRLVAPFGMRHVAAQLSRFAARCPPSVLISGERGTGQRLIAAAIAEKVERREHFVAVDLGTIPASMLESELFGHAKRAFRGAHKAGGVVFLDEIGKLPLALQAKLLGVLEDREGDVMVIAATHGSLRAMVDRGEFREDLLTRLAAVHITLPPLRHRREDIFEIVLRRGEEVGAPYDPELVEDEAVERLLLHPWSGNVPALHQALETIAGKLEAPALTMSVVQEVLDSQLDRPPAPPGAGTLP